MQAIFLREELPTFFLLILAVGFSVAAFIRGMRFSEERLYCGVWSAVDYALSVITLLVFVLLLRRYGSLRPLARLYGAAGLFGICAAVVLTGYARARNLHRKIIRIEAEERKKERAGR